MERCTLCGGKLAGGRCTECGLDNTKNDRKYNLNIHNDKAVRFHQGKCDDHINKPTKKVKKRRQIGTVKPKGRFKLIIAAIVVLFMIANGISDFWSEVEEFWEESPGSYREDISESYIEEPLKQGLYYVGQDIPAGKYQAYCGKDYAGLYWYDTDGYIKERWALWSQEYLEQNSMDESVSDSLTDTSSVITVTDGMFLYVLFGSNDVWLMGEADSDAQLLKPEPQNLKTVEITGKSAVVGKDFPAGTYNLVLSESCEYGVSVEIREAEGNTFYLYLDQNSNEFYQFSFLDDTEMKIEQYGQGEINLQLVPTF